MVSSRPIRTKFSRQGAVAVASSAALTLLVACGSGNAGGDDASAGENAGGDAAAGSPENQITDLIVDSLEEPDSLDPLFRDTPEAARVYRLLYSSLMQWNEDATLSPDLAADAPRASEDGLTWTVALKENLAFHDGSALTSSDVVHTVEAAQDPENGAVWLSGLASVESVEAVDDLTVEFKLREPFAHFESKLAMLPIISDEDDYAVNDTYASTENGSGPYILRELNRGDSIVLERFDDYYGEPFAFETITFKVVPEDSSRIARLTNGETHIVPKLPVDQLEQVESRGANATTVEGNVSRLFFFASMNEDRPTSNTDFRLAIAHAIDRGRIVDQVFDGAARPNSTYLTYGTLFHDEEIGLTFGDSPDLEKAQQYLDASGVNLDRPFEIIALKLPHITNTATIIQANLKELGIDAEVRSLDLAGFYDDLVGGTYDVILWDSPASISTGFAPDYVNGGLNSTSADNFGRFKDPKMDELLHGALTAMTEDQQEAAWKKVQQYDVTTQGNIQIVVSENAEGWSKDLGADYEPSALAWLNTLRQVK